jgi:hypothetical protein
MISVEEFREKCRREAADDIVSSLLLADYSKHVSGENREFLRDSLARKFQLVAADIQLWVVGSAKFGFSIAEKIKDNQLLPRYRPFGPLSDIDMAIVSPRLFRLVWDELCIYSHGYSWFPWRSGALGDYMLCGWLRPDYFPRIRRCDDWWDLFRRFSYDPRFGRRRVRGGLFHSTNDLHRYQLRAVEECVSAEMVS